MDLLRSLEAGGVIINQAKLLLHSGNLREPELVETMSLVEMSARDLGSGRLSSASVFRDHPELGLRLVPPATALHILLDALSNPDLQPFYKTIGMKPIRHNEVNIGVLAVGYALKESYVALNTWTPRREFYLDVHWLHGSNFDYANLGQVVFQRT